MKHTGAGASIEEQMSRKSTLSHISILQLCCLAALVLAVSGCNGRVLIMRRESAPAMNAGAPHLGQADEARIVAIPDLRRADQREGVHQPDYTQIQRAAERTLTDHIQGRLIGAKRLKLVDRRHVLQIMAEHAIQRSALADPAKRKKLGRLLAADYLLLGEVTEYRIINRPIGPYRTRVNISSVGFSLELVDVETGEKVWKVVHSGTGQRLLHGKTVKFAIDPVLDTIEENGDRDKAGLSDLSALAELLIREATASLRD